MADRFRLPLLPFALAVTVGQPVCNLACPYLNYLVANEFVAGRNVYLIDK